MDRATDPPGAHCRPPETRPVWEHSGGAGGPVRSIHHVTLTLAPSPRPPLPAASAQVAGQAKIARAMRAFFLPRYAGQGRTARRARGPTTPGRKRNDERRAAGPPGRCRPGRSCCSRPSSARTRRGGPSTPGWSPTITTTRARKRSRARPAASPRGSPSTRRPRPPISTLRRNTARPLGAAGG